MAKVTLKSLKVCKQCDQGKVTGMPMTKAAEELLFKSVTNI